MNHCIVCKAIIRGRTDKKYCSKMCSNKFHAEKRKKLLPESVLLTNRILLKNRSILQGFFEGEKRKKVKVDKLVLSKLGFNFKYITGIYYNRERKRYHYVYDFAWMEFSTQEVLLIKK